MYVSTYQNTAFDPFEMQFGIRFQLCTCHNNIVPQDDFQKRRKSNLEISYFCFLHMQYLLFVLSVKGKGRIDCPFVSFCLY